MKRIYSWMLHISDQQDMNGSAIKEWMDVAISYNKKLDITPTAIEIDGKGYPDRLVKFENGYKKLTTKEYKEVKGISLYTEEPDTDNYSFYWKALLDITFSKITGLKAYIGVDMNIAVNKEQVLNDIITPICNLLDVQYGYSYVMPPEKGSFSYGHGFVHVPAGHPLPDRENELIAKFNAYRKTINEGMMRDVYQENLLSEVQLNRQVDGKRLQDWIKSDSSHGTLSDFAGIKLWKVTKDQLVKVRNMLHKNDLLIAYDESVIPGLPD